MTVKTRPDMWLIKSDGTRYKVVNVVKDKDLIVLRNEQTGVGFETNISKIDRSTYSIEVEQGFVKPETKMTRKEAKVIIGALKDEARPWLSRLVEMEAELEELPGGKGEAKMLSYAVSRLSNWIEELK